MIWRRRYRNVEFGNLRLVQNQSEALVHLKTPRSLALVLAGDQPKMLMFECPSGCGEVLRINLMPGSRRAWGIRIDKVGRVTLHPSVDLTSGCLTHFYFANNVARIIYYV